MSERLALEGGAPVRKDPIPFHEPDLTGQELEGVAGSLDSGWVAGPGPEAERFEERLENRWDVPRVLTTTSCTHALETALMSLGLSSEAEVIVPSFTFVSTASAVLRTGGTPVFADVNPETLTLSTETVRPKISERTRAIVHVHYGGFPRELDKLQKLCDKYDLDLLEDAAQAFDGTVNGKVAGSLGRYGTLSFHGSKSMTCGEGGVLVVNNPEDVKRCELIRDKGTDRSADVPTESDRYTWRSEGSSYVLSDILASILNVQLDRWLRIKGKRKNIRRRLHRGVKEIDGGRYFRTISPPEECEDNGHVTAVLCTRPSRSKDFRNALRAEGVTVHRHYEPLHESPFVRQTLNRRIQLPVTERVSSSVLRLPTHTNLGDEDVDAILEAFEKVYDHLLN